MRAAALALLAAVGLAGDAAAQADPAARESGAAAEADPPGPERDAGAPADPGAPEGARQTAHGVRDFDRYELPIGRFGLDAPAVRPVEGTVVRSAWRLDDSQASVAAVVVGYRERLAALGFEPIFDCVGEGCGGFDFRFGAEILPPPAMLMDVRDFAQLSAARDEPEGYISVLVSRVLDSVHVQTVSAAPAEAPVEVAGLPAEDVEPPLDVPEAPVLEAPRETAALADDERALLERLMAEGHVPVAGLEFEVGGTELSPGSAQALDMLARLLARDEGLAVAIVGHSDNQGPLDLNIDLSRRRAEAVMRALIERGVPAGPLEARGVGYLAPVTSNATEAGRAQNRRVELVLR